jgi:hypothetical protein
MGHVTVRGVRLAVTVATLCVVFFGAFAVPSASAGPVLPIPAGLWRPAAASVPSTGDYVLLDSDPGDYIAQGQKYLYTKANADLSVSANGGLLSISVSGHEWWNGNFQTMSTLTQLEPGYYPGLTRYPFNDPATGGLDWSGQGRGSNTLTGWFAIDSVTYANGSLTSIDLRFEQHSDGWSPALNGAIHWEAGDQTQPPGPVLPIPDGLWRPAAASIPSTGDYVLLDSDPGDYIGQGLKYMYTPANSTIIVAARNGRLLVNVDGWTGNFQTMSSVSDLEPGYYPALTRYPFGNPATGGLDWSGKGRGSNDLTGWFAIDSATYANGYLTSIDLRFEQHSEGRSPALHGAIHWRAEDTTPMMATSLTLTAPMVCEYGWAILSGSLKDADAQPLADTTVTVQYFASGAWRTFGSTTTDAAGAYVYAAAPTTGTTYQAVFAGNSTYAGSASASAPVIPRVLLSKPAAPRSTRTTTSFACSCYLMPQHPAGSPAVSFECQRCASGHWITKKMVPAVATDSSDYTACFARIRLNAKGSWRIRSVHAADAGNAATTSGWLSVKVS